MKRQDRTPEVYFYEWSVSSWHNSDTRHQLDSAGRGIFREILDLCYTQGSITKDRKLLASQCGCTEAEMEAVWPIISRHFFTKKNDSFRMENSRSNAVRKHFFAYVSSQRKKGKKGGEVKAKGIIEISSSGLSKPVAKERRGKESIDKESRGEEKKNAREQPPQKSPQKNDLQDEPDSAKVLERIYERHPYKGRFVDAEYHWSLILQSAVSPDAVIADIERKHQEWCEYWKTQRFKPFLFKWFEDKQFIDWPPSASSQVRSKADQMFERI